MHFHNFCTEIVTIFIKIDYAHKEKILLQIIINACDRGGIKTQSKMMVAAKWCCFHSCRNKLFNGKPILRFGVAPFLFILVVLFFGCAISLVSRLTTKAAMAFLKSFNIFQ